MIYHFKLSHGSDEEFVFYVKIRGNQNFLEFNDLILNKLEYDTTQMSSFYKLDLMGNRCVEIALFEMESEDEDKNPMQIISMDVCQIKEFVSLSEPKMIFVFDIFSDRYFNLELVEISETDAEINSLPILHGMEGEIPQQIDIDSLGFSDLDIPELDMDVLKSKTGELDEQMYNSEEDSDEDGMNFENLDDYQDIL